MPKGLTWTALAVSCLEIERRRVITDGPRFAIVAEDFRPDAYMEDEQMAKQTPETVQKIVEQAAATVLNARGQAVDRSAGSTERVKEIGSSLLDSAKEQIPHIQQRVAEQASPKMHTLSTQVHELAAVGGTKARDVSTRVNEEVLPTLREVALNAASAAVELWEAARERALEAAQETQQEVGPVAKHGLSAGTEKAKDASHLLAAKVSDGTGHAKDATRHAADATVTTSRDAGAALLWGAAAAGLIYYGFMDKDRRAQTLKTINGMVGGTRELIRDVRGYDANF